MLDRIPWVYVELVRGVAVCFAAGAIAGLTVATVRLWMEGRRGS